MWLVGCVGTSAHATHLYSRPERYAHGRSDTCLKVKPYQEAKARVREVFVALESDEAKGVEGAQSVNSLVVRLVPMLVAASSTYCVCMCVFVCVCVWYAGGVARRAGV